MYVFLIAATSVDGFIAQDLSQSSISWRSKADRDFFIKKTKEAGVVVMGKNTAKTSRRPLPGRRNIIYGTSAEGLEHWQEYGEWELTQEAPRNLIKKIAEEGHENLAICGGSSIYTQFIEAGAIDALYITVEPVLFGQGIALFNKPLEIELELRSVEQLSDEGTLLKTYIVKK